MNKQIPCIECGIEHSLLDLDSDYLCPECNNYELDVCDLCGLDDIECDCFDDNDELFDDDNLYGFGDDDFNDDDDYNEEDDWEGDDGY